MKNANAINSVKVAKVKSNAFDLSHDVKLSCKMGDLVPVLAMECVPGDRIRISAEALARFAPLVSPMMHRVDLHIHYFFVPNRLVWDKWEEWISNGSQNGTQTGNPLPAHPVIRYAQSHDNTNQVQRYTDLMDYMGLPAPGDIGPDQNLAYETISALPFGAYQLIWREYYRDENLQTDVQGAEGLQDGINYGGASDNLVSLRRRCWEADYFTKALPWAQKGAPVDIPLGNVELIPDTGPGLWKQGNATANPLDLADLGTDAGGVTIRLADNVEGVYDPNGSLQVDATTINDLRLAFRLQEWLEKNARGGTRYSELIRSHFNVKPEDARLQRPEYITGVKVPMQISEVLNTTGTEALPQGNMAGHGITYANGKFGKYFCTEHGYIIGIMSIMPKTCYQQGIPRHFLKYTDPTQIYWPSFAHIGEQEVLNRELYAFRADGNETFGYMPRYQEYKTLHSRVAGEFRRTLDYWHMGRIFANQPQLNAAFVQADPTKRVFAVDGPDQQDIFAHVQNSIMAIRPMPIYGTPTF